MTGREIPPPTGNSSGICLKTLYDLAREERKNRPDAEKNAVEGPVACRLGLSLETFIEILSKDKAVKQSFGMGFGRSVADETGETMRKAMAGDVDAILKRLKKDGYWSNLAPALLPIT